MPTLGGGQRVEIASLIIGLLLGFFIYRKGLMDGQGLKTDKPIQALKVPFSMPKTSKNEESAEDLLAKSWANLMAFDGNPQMPDKGGE
jgi:hypothetical protein